MLKPAWGFWFLLAALLPLAFRAAGGQRPLPKTSLDGLVLVFLCTAFVGYWASYNQQAAWNKLWFVVTGALLYYALSGQPRKNLEWVCMILFCLGVGVSLHFLLAYDFAGSPRKLQIVNDIGQWIAAKRPQFGWVSAHPNYVAGIAAITVPFIIYPWIEWRKGRGHARIFEVGAAIGVLISLFAIFMATSRGVVMAILGAFGVWLTWQVVDRSRINFRVGREALFPIINLLYLCLTAVLLYAGPANLAGTFSGDYFFGTGSRAELFGRSLYLLADFPLTGGGLAAFPGLYSDYLLGIPHFNVPNSHNLFLDVAIEQGLAGGLAYLLIFLACIWSVSRAAVRPAAREMQVFNWLVLFALVTAAIHGMVDDYLYNGMGSGLALFLAGVSAVVDRESRPAGERMKKPAWSRVLLVLLLALSLMALPFFSRIMSIWYADVGAVQLARVELAGFPDSGWPGTGILPKLQEADASLQIAHQFDPENVTANYRLGLIAMYRRDFGSASRYLEVAHAQAPDHRGIKKALGYSYLWMGDTARAQEYLAAFPETSGELDAYCWWWNNQERADLANRAYRLLANLRFTPSQP